MSSTKKTPSAPKQPKTKHLVEDKVAALIAEIEMNTDVVNKALGKIRDAQKQLIVLVNSRAMKPAESQAAKKAVRPPVKETAKEKFIKDLSGQQAPVPEMQAGKKPADEKAGKDAVRGSSVRQSPHEITLNIGSQPVRELAESDAKDLLNNPKVFWYRPIQFPDPKRYKVQPRVMAAKVVERKDPKFTRAPWTVSVTISATGDDKRCESWLSGVLNKNKSDQE